MQRYDNFLILQIFWPKNLFDPIFFASKDVMEIIGVIFVSDMERNINHVADTLVIIPMYNERENARAIIEAVLGLSQQYDVLVVDDNSPDGTADIVRKAMADFPGRINMIERAGKLGLGTAYIEGFRYGIANGYDYITEMDADFSHNPNDLPKLRQACADGGYDVAVGSRYISGVNVVNWPMGRVLMSYYASAYVRFVTRMKVRDTTAGFVCYRRQVLETMELDKIRFKGYAFQIEMKFTALKCGFSLTEVPIIFVNRVLGTSKMSSGIFSEAVFGVVRLKVSSWFRKYPKKADEQA
jgi:dolichol-phosphate mannosyltransferase